MTRDSILVLGAGMAGLAAAEELARAGLPVILLEARDRVGGRVHTMFQPGLEPPVEVGAEFIHGAKNASWPFVRKARLKTDELPDRHWQFFRGRLAENRNFWEQLSAVTEKIDLAAPDQNFCSILQHVAGVSETGKWLATEYVEGFHAAPVERISVHSIARAEAAAEREDGMRQFRLRQGYGGLADWFVQQLNKRAVRVLYQHIVKTICWEPGEVEIQAATPNGPVILRGKAALVTLPLGVLKESGPTDILFEPPLKEKRAAIEGLETGAVIKVVFHFRAGFWPVKNFGFLHADDPNFPTWWVDERGPLLTGWAGGSRAERLSNESRETILAEAIESLTRIFKMEPRRIQDLVVASWTHDWTNDQYSRGAYSYVPVGMGQMPSRLSEPVQDTLFFAGEATADPGDQGTVHGALESAKRAVEQIRKSVSLEAGKPRRRTAVV